MDVCDFTDLPADMCEHCNPAPSPPRLEGTVAHRMTARYSGACENCGERIREGEDEIALVEGAWVCARYCAPRQ